MARSNKQYLIAEILLRRGLPLSVISAITNVAEKEVAELVKKSL